MPVLSAATVRYNQIDSIEIGLDLPRKVFRGDVGCIRLDAPTHRINVTEKNQFIDSKDPAGF